MACEDGLLLPTHMPFLYDKNFIQTFALILRPLY